MSQVRRPDRRRGGQTVVETALVINLLLLVILGVFEYGHIIMIKQLMDNAAREGARMAVVSTQTNPATTTAQIQSAVSGYLAGQPVQNLAINVFEANPTTNANIGPWTAAPFGVDIAVTVDADYQPMIPTSFGILPNPLHFTARSVMRSEAN